MPRASIRNRSAIRHRPEDGSDSASLPGSIASEGELRPHRHRIEARTHIHNAGGARLPGDVAMQIVQHEPDVVSGVPVQAGRVDSLPSAGDAGRGGELIVEIHNADATGDLKRTP